MIAYCILLFWFSTKGIFNINKGPKIKLQKVNGALKLVWISDVAFMRSENHIAGLLSKCQAEVTLLYKEYFEKFYLL